MLGIGALAPFILYTINMERIFSLETIALLKTLWVNQAWACQIAIQLLLEYQDNNRNWKSFADILIRLKRKFEESPYDEYE